MKLLSFRHLFLSFALVLPVTSDAFDDQNQPGSILSDGVEFFSIACSGMSQQTTIDMDTCMMVQLDQVEWVREKYLAASLNRIKKDNESDGQRLQKLTVAFDAENRAWEDLINKASTSAGIDSSGGTAIGLTVARRQIGLTELQVHDIWQNWLRFQDSTPPLLPEPKFNSDQ